MTVSKARQVQIAQRRTRAVQMRLAGVSYAVIADQLGYASAGAANKDVTRALAATMKDQHESSEQLLRLELDRLDRLMAGVWTRACGGDVKSVEAAERLIMRRCALLGLDLIHRNGAGDGDVASLLGSLFTALQTRHAPAEVEVIDVLEASPQEDDGAHAPEGADGAEGAAA
ncbi:hypothetical protein [Bailinhaonella thermotolerans]|uniref:hypothetical protein n=1 Tax=Bailinhaonella thermotolerans TaxID=1070861 RepID=UPI00192A6255|nr:hypothetical protein [Bailinhaonella thermotolerans]